MLEEVVVLWVSPWNSQILFSIFIGIQQVDFPGPPTVHYMQCAELILANIENEPSGDQDKENNMGRKMVQPETFKYESAKGSLSSGSRKIGGKWEENCSVCISHL